MARPPHVDEGRDVLHRRHWAWAGLLAVCIAVIIAVAAMLTFFFFQAGLGPQQPISFSHKLHVSDKGISCVMCHGNAIDTPRAGVPPLETCMLCHKHIIIHHPQVELLREHYYSGQPVPWVRVNQVPDFVYFNHSRHVQHGFDCGRCHGNVAAMDRVSLPNRLDMGFCVQCHRDNNYSVDCLICHR
jgi:hypothetical protein